MRWQTRSTGTSARTERLLEAARKDGQRVNARTTNSTPNKCDQLFIRTYRVLLEGSSLNDCWEPGIKRGLNPAGVYELARVTYSRLSAPLSPAQSLLPNISFKTTNAAVGTRHFDAHRDAGKRFIVRAEGKLTTFVELEAAIRAP